ncbi:hydroxymethylbilane synthase [Sphingobacteriales bacterium UPWRP_1]|nr:hydroxymethylbilane synthase [Sphingobacteriales bacterium TSM_CSM]PSJ78126.1 hydroxymethylbilane synthase [Sphingobacteriales bacterium UPWRP_1]
MKRTIIIGSRGSDLALWQARFTQQQLAQQGVASEIKVIKTRGDATQHLSFAKMEGKGFFTKEIEDALLNGSIDLAVHSFKDLPTQNTSGLLIAACSYRETPFDTLLINPNATDETLPMNLKRNATVGTSAARRKAQLRALRPDLQLVDIRGNVPTRMAKALTELDAVVLASAGLERLGLDLSALHCVQFTPQQMVPAPAQGVLAYQIRQSDTELYPFVYALNHPDVSALSGIERSIMQQLGGGCQQPVGVYCTKTKNRYYLWVSWANNEHEFPKRLFLQSSTKQGLVKKAVSVLKNAGTKSVFLSRAATADSYFYRALSQRNYQLFAHSLIDFEAVPFELNTSFDWIFFSSKNAVHYFFAANPTLPAQVKIAALGAGTASAVKQRGLMVHFEGTNSKPQEVAALFAETARNQTVLFPQAEHSLQTVQQALQNRISAINLIVYKNTPAQQFTIPPSDILIFTSPLNVKAYCSRYEIKPTQKVIAIGDTTAAALEKHHCTHYTLPYMPDEISLADVCW